MSTLRGRWTAALTTVMTVIIAVPTRAQTAPPVPGSDIQEIIVTARKRDESFQSVPITVNVFTTQEIQSAGIESPRDFVAMVPNMTMVETQNVGNSFITIRGISQARNSEPSVAVLVDGVLETNPYEFNQELFDIKQIEVLKGPQGALYGRDAIGGAIIITTADPSDHFEGTSPGGRGQRSVREGAGCPQRPARFRRDAALPRFVELLQYRRLSAERISRPQGRPVSRRLGAAAADMEAFRRVQRGPAVHVRLDRYHRLLLRHSPQRRSRTRSAISPRRGTPTTRRSPIQNNNLGTDYRNILDTALKLDYSPGYGTFTSISDFNHTKEIDTGDAYDFRPVTTSVEYALTGGVPRRSGRPVRRESEPVHRREDLEPGAALHVPHASGASRGSRARTTSTPSASSPRAIWRTGDWASPPSITLRWSIRRIRSRPTRTRPSSRTARTTTPGRYLPMRPTSSPRSGNSMPRYATTRIIARTRPIRPPSSCRRRRPITGEVRKVTYSATQPKATLRYKPNDDWTFYGGWSRGFRSGGFNQTGVGAVARANGVLGVNDTFNAEIADTSEIGFKSQFLDRRLSVDGDVFYTKSTNGYFFVYIAADSTQNLGNLDATYKGAELSLTARPTDRLNLYASYGYTDSRITAMADPTVIGNQAPLVSKNTINAGRAVSSAPRRRPQRNGAPGLSGNRTHLVGAVQHHIPGPGLAGGSAARAASGADGRSPPGRRTSPTRSIMPSSRRAT